jgi:NPCBM/NEW2 domain
VFADSKELYANPDLKASGPPVPLKVTVTGALRLRLVVDFGRGQDTGDRVIWANARLFRTQPAGGAKAPKTAAAYTDGPAGAATAVRRD